MLRVIEQIVCVYIYIYDDDDDAQKFSRLTASDVKELAIS